MHPMCIQVFSIYSLLPVPIELIPTFLFQYNSEIGFDEISQIDSVGLQGAWAASSAFGGARRSSCSSISNKNIWSTSICPFLGQIAGNNIPVALRDTALSFHEFCVKLKTELYRQIN